MHRFHKLLLGALAVFLAAVFQTLAAPSGPIVWGAQKFDFRDFDKPFTKFAMGYGHTVGLHSNRTVAAWGLNVEESGFPFGQMIVPTGLGTVTAISAIGYYTVTLKSDGTVVAWGTALSGDMTLPAGLSGVSAIAAGPSHTVALKNDGTVVAWGANESGQTTAPVD